MDVLLHYIAPFFGILLGLIVIHEAGHYVTAKLFGVRVLEAGIGLPPRIWGFRYRDTDYTLNALPLGAFVRMLGEEDPEAQEDGEALRVPGEMNPQSLAAQPKWKRTIIIGSGAFLNLIVAIVLFSLSLMIPKDISNSGVVVAEVIPDSPAANAGLQPNDEIVEVNGRDVRNAQEAVYLVRLNQGSEVNFTVRREDPRTGAEIVKIENVYARWDPPEVTDECGVTESQGMTGIRLSPKNYFNGSWTAEELVDLEDANKDAYAEHKQDIAEGSPGYCYGPADYGFVGYTQAQCDALDPADRDAALALKQELFAEAASDCYLFRPSPPVEVPLVRISEPPWEAIPNGVRLSFESIILTRNQVWTMIRGFSDAPVTGPVGIAQATGEVVEQAGWRYLIEFSAAISMSLAILNFLPIPMVDGGRLAFIFIEFIRGGRRISPQREAMVHFVGFAAMILLFFVISYFDIIRIIRGDSLLQ